MPKKSVQQPQDPEPSHAYDAPGLSPRAFLLRVMHAPDAAIRDRVRAASELLRLFPHDYYIDFEAYGRDARLGGDWDPPSAKIVIGGIPEHCGSLSSDPGATDERLGNSSHSSAIAQEGSSPMMEKPGSPNIETIISDIKSGNIPELTLCTKCGHLMPFPCVKTLSFPKISSCRRFAR